MEVQISVIITQSVRSPKMTLGSGGRAKNQLSDWSLTLRILPCAVQTMQKRFSVRVLYLFCREKGNLKHTTLPLG